MGPQGTKQSDFITTCRNEVTTGDQTSTTDAYLILGLEINIAGAATIGGGHGGGTPHE
jgi:hypothetical protein